MSKKKYDEKKVLRQLARKGIKYDTGGCLEIPDNGISPIGIHTWGKIDFLVHYCGYRYRIVKVNENVQNKIAYMLGKEVE